MLKTQLNTIRTQIFNKITQEIQSLNPRNKILVVVEERKREQERKK